MAESFVTDIALEPATTEAAPVECVHVWLIETQPGAQSPGVCQKCGAVKGFTNWLAQTQWEDYGKESLGADSDSTVRSLDLIRAVKGGVGESEWEEFPLAEAS